MGQAEDNRIFHEYCEALRARFGKGKRVMFVQAPQFLLDAFNPEVAKEKGYYAFPPSGLQYLYAVLADRDLEFRILDLNYEMLRRVAEDRSFRPQDWLSILDERLAAFHPEIVGVSCMFDAGIRPMLKTLECLQHYGQAIVVTGGVIASYEWKNLLEKGLCHFVVKGEGENRIDFLFDQLTHENRNRPATAGIYFRVDNEVLETTGSREPVRFDRDLIRSYALVPVERYYEVGSLNPFSRMAGLHDAPYAAIQMNRGCRGACSFCAVRDFMGKGVRKRSVETVLAEMEFLVKERGIRHFEWLDDDLLCFKADFTRLLQTIIDRQWGISWSANNGLIASSLDPDLLRLMRESGCIGFKIGIETGNAIQLKKVNKPATLDTFREVAVMLRDYPEIFVGGNFIVGLPQETFAQMLDSLHFYLELQLDWGAFTLCQAIRGATAFDDFGDYFSEQMRSGGANVHNFIPVRESHSGHLAEASGIRKGLEVFALAPDLMPEQAQMREIWFTFNLVGNYIFNKNLMPGGVPHKFIAWVKMAQAAYPVNPYMCFFLAVAYLLKGEEAVAREYLGKAVAHVRDAYWQERLGDCGLLAYFERFPHDRDEAYAMLGKLRMQCRGQMVGGASPARESGGKIF